MCAQTRTFTYEQVIAICQVLNPFASTEQMGKVIDHIAPERKPAPAPDPTPTPPPAPAPATEEPRQTNMTIAEAYGRILAYKGIVEFATMYDPNENDAELMTLRPRKEEDGISRKTMDALSDAMRALGGYNYHGYAPCCDIDIWRAAKLAYERSLKPAPTKDDIAAAYAKIQAYVMHNGEKQLNINRHRETVEIFTDHHMSERKSKAISYALKDACATIGVEKFDPCGMITLNARAYYAAERAYKKTAK